MKIPMMQSITAIKAPKVEHKSSAIGDSQIKQAKLNREYCLKLIVNGERNIDELVRLIGKHLKTLHIYLKEFAANGLIELVIGRSLKTKIVNVL